MPPLYRIFEVALYSLLNFLPFLLLALYPFRKTLRFSLPATFPLIGILSLFQAGIGALSAFSGGFPEILTVASTLVCALFYFAAVKARLGKTLFTLLMLYNYANLLIVTSKCLEGLIFGTAMAQQPYRWTQSVCMIVMHLIITLPLSYYFRRHFSPGISKQSGSPVWRYLWLIPATFYLIWYYHLYFSSKTPLEVALQPDHALFLLFINLGAFLIYHTVIILLNESERRSCLEEQNHLLALQNLQHENLQERISETRQVKHDLRHHIHIMSALLRDRKLEELETYLSQYQKSLPDDSTIVFCQNYSVNALLLYFAQQAKAGGIDYAVSVKVPEQLELPDNVLSVVLGNLLENAIEACAGVTDRPAKITIKGKANADVVFFQIENTCSGKLTRDKNGFFLSSKHSGLGIGLRSVQNIAAQYDGLLEVEQKDGIFRACVMLTFPKDASR